MTDIEQLRAQPLDESTIDPNPIVQFKRWYDEAIAAGAGIPDSMTLATVTPDGKPSARMVLLKRVEENGFVFFTNYQSRKGQEIDRNANVSLLFYWATLDRQVRIDGVAEKISPEESDAYFGTRSRESQLGAWASAQSQVIGSRQELERAFARFEADYAGREIPRPPHWGGYRVKPATIEFWQSRPARLHDRILCALQGDGRWRIQRLAP